MQFELHTAGTRGAATLIGTLPTFAAARAAYDATPLEGEGAAWAIVPTGRADELATLGELDSINPRYSSGLFVQRCGNNGFSCLGFEVAEGTRKACAAWLRSEGQSVPEHTDEIGTPDAWRAYLETLAAVRAYHEKTSRRCPASLTPQLMGLEGARVEVVDSYGERRRFTVGKSTGWIPCHLELKGANSNGGDPVTGAPFKSLNVIRAAR